MYCEAVAVHILQAIRSRMVKYYTYYCYLDTVIVNQIIRTVVHYDSLDEPPPCLLHTLNPKKSFLNGLQSPGRLG